MENEIKKKRGRPKTKEGKKVTFYLSLDSIKKLKEMTIIGRNASALIEALINQAYYSKKLEKKHG